MSKKNGAVVDQTLNKSLSKKSLDVLKILAQGYDWDDRAIQSFYAKGKRLLKKHYVWAVAGSMLSQPSKKKPKLQFGWYIVRCQPGHERKVIRDVKRKANINWLAKLVGKMLVVRTKSLELHGGKRKIFKRKRFPCYVLARVKFCDDIRTLFDRIKSCYGFLGVHLVTIDKEGKKLKPDEQYLTDPIQLSQQEVDRILAEHSKAIVKEEIKVTTGIRPGDKARITEGTFQNFKGTVKKVSGEGSAEPIITVTVEIIGRPTDVNLQHWQLKLIQEDV